MEKETAGEEEEEEADVPEAMASVQWNAKRGKTVESS